MLTRITQGLVVATGIMTAAPVVAAPLLSGSYMTSETEFCQIEAKVDSGTGQITIGKGGTGQPGVVIYVAAFDAGAGTYSFSGWGSSESVIYQKFSDGSHIGSHAKDYTISNNGTYSNTDTSVTFTTSLGVTTTFNVIYGPLESGVAQSFTALLQHHPNAQFIKTCVDTIVAQHQ